MLTNVYYYGFYKPYIINKQPKSTVGAYRAPGQKSVSKDASNAESAPVVNLQKNNAVKRDVIKYAQDIYKNVTEMKDSAKYLNNNAESYYLNVLDESFDTARNWALEDIAFFTESYNDAVDFGLGQTHSADLNRYAADMVNISLENRKDLEPSGISLSKDGTKMSFDPETLKSKDYLDFGTSLADLKHVSSKIYNRTKDVLDKPLTEHMSFKQLSYYYNYRISKKQSNGFSLIESGLILDKII